MSSGTAEKCFIENRNMFANTQGTPEEQEKWNLYNGLGNLAAAVQSLEHHVEALTRALQHRR